MASLHCLLLVLSFCGILLAIGTATMSDSDDVSWFRKVEFDSGFKAKWRIEKDKEGEKWIRMRMSAPTPGYVGIGFSSNGAMHGSDFVIGWVDDNGEAHLNDYYGIGNEAPILDKSQDVQLTSAIQTKDGTILEFRRRWATCDEDQDYELTTDTIRMLWAFGEADPILQNDGTHLLKWHGKYRGVKSVFLEDETNTEPFPDTPGHEDPDVKYWDVHMDNVQVKDDTLYHCRMVKVPNLTKKHHFIGYRPNLEIANRDLLHHFSLYECHVPLGETNDLFEKHLNDTTGTTCYTNAMPGEWGQHCIQFSIVWAVGSEGEMFPKHVGIPVGQEHGGATYFMAQAHYNNPEKKVFTDSSGLRIFYTDKLRENDGGHILTGYSVSQFHMTPPGVSDFKNYGMCSSDCTAKTFPPEGIKIIGVLLHAHLAGRKLKLRHIRNGVELPIIAIDNNYDFNYQQTRMLKHEVTVLPGDELLTECSLSTMDRKDLVLGGLSTMQEMCQSLFMYYPRIELNNCRSQAEFYHFFNALGIESVTGNVLKAMQMPYSDATFQSGYEPLPNSQELEKAGEGLSYSNIFDLLNISQPASLKDVNVGEYLKHQFDWKNKAKEVEEIWRDGQQYAFCTLRNNKRAPLKDNIIPFARIDKPYKIPKSVYCGVKLNEINEKLQLKSTGTQNKNYYFNILFSVVLLTTYYY